jgi:hypothetical protein
LIRDEVVKMANVHDFPSEPDQDFDQETNGNRPSKLDQLGEKTSDFFGKLGSSLRKKRPDEGLMDEILAVAPMEELRRVVGSSQETEHDVDSVKDALGLYIDSRRVVLSQDLTKPSWGPKIRTRNFKRGKAKVGTKARGMMSFGRKNDAEVAFDRHEVLEPTRLMHDQDQAISFNLEQSRRYHQFLWLYLGAALASVVIVTAALSVDYSILKEFWYQAMMNEYMMVPPELLSSVPLKALQVLFATIGIHLVLRHMPRWVVTGFTAIIFVMTVGMMLAIGFLYAHKTLPADNQATLAGETTEQSGLFGSLEDSGVSMGAGSDDENVGVITNAFEGVFSSEDLAIIDAIGWLVALTMIFLVVASIGALFMLWGEHNIRNFILARDYRERKFETERLRLAEAVALQIHMPEPESQSYR